MDEPCSDVLGPPPYVAYGCFHATDLDDRNGPLARNQRLVTGSGAEPSSANMAKRMAWNIGYTS
jgi:hypothetical protein